MVVQVNDLGMVASELRHLNWVVYPDYHKDGSEKFWMVRTAYFHDVDYIDLTDGKYQARVSFDNIKPIPLTEEILKTNLGFYVDSHDGVKFISIGRINKAMEIYFVIVGEILVMSIRIDLQFIDLGPRVKYLHQFQNLYKELTMGQELNVKL